MGGTSPWQKAQDKKSAHGKGGGKLQRNDLNQRGKDFSGGKKGRRGGGTPGAESWEGRGAKKKKPKTVKEKGTLKRERERTTVGEKGGCPERPWVTSPQFGLGC